MDRLLVKYHLCRQETFIYELLKTDTASVCTKRKCNCIFNNEKTVKQQMQFLRD